MLRVIPTTISEVIFSRDIILSFKLRTHAGLGCLLEFHMRCFVSLQHTNDVIAEMFIKPSFSFPSFQNLIKS